MIFLKSIIGIAVGAILGYSYWYFIGCNSGSCAITSSPLNSALYGSVIGVLLTSSYSRKQKQQ